MNHLSTQTKNVEHSKSGSMDFAVPLSQWIQNLKFDIVPVLRACDRRRCFLHSKKFAEIALMLDLFRKNLDTLTFLDRLATRDEVAKFHKILGAVLDFRNLVEGFDRSHFLESLLKHDSNFVLEKVAEFRNSFNSLALSLNLVDVEPLKFNPEQFAINNVEDVNVAVHEIRRLLDTTNELNEEQKKVLKERIFDLNRLKVQHGGRHQSLPSKEIDARLSAYKRWVFDESEFFRDEGVKLGSGGFGDVYLGYRKSTGETVAMKMLRCNELTAHQMDTLDRELRILSSFEHPCILPFIGLVRSPSYSIITRYMSNGSLFNKLHNGQCQMTPLDATQKTIIAIGVAHGMEYLHSKHLIHRDLKSLNVLLDDMMYPRIGDFGLSRQRADSNDVMTKGVGTSQWMAPEVIKSESYDERADVYSFAMVLWEMLTHQVPWQDSWSVVVANSVANDGKRPIIPTSCPAKLRSVILSCWDSDVERRLPFTRICAMFDSGEVCFDGADRGEVEKYLKYLGERIPKEDALFQAYEDDSLDVFVEKYGCDSAVDIVLQMIDKCSVDPDKHVPKLAQAIGFVMSKPETAEKFRKERGIKKFVRILTQDGFIVNPEAVICLMELGDGVRMSEKLVGALNESLLSTNQEVRQKVVEFFSAKVSETKESMLAMIIPNLLANLETENDELVHSILCLFEEMSKNELLLDRISEGSAALCEALESVSERNKDKILNLLKLMFATHRPSKSACAHLIQGLEALLQTESLQKQALFVLTQMVNSTASAISALRSLQSNPLIGLLNTEDDLVIQSLKLIFLEQESDMILDVKDLKAIQALLQSENDAVAALAAACLVVAPNYIDVVDESLSAFLRRAFEHENALTLQGLRLCGVLSQVSDKHPILASFEKQICELARSKTTEIARTALMVLASISYFDQLSENLVQSTPVAVMHIGNDEMSDTALVFLCNMTVNYDAAMLAAPALPGLVKLLQSGNHDALAPIHRILIVGECLDACRVCLGDLIRACEPFLHSGAVDVVIEIFDSVAKIDEAKQLMRNTEIPEFLQERLQEMGKTDPTRTILMRLLRRLK